MTSITDFIDDYSVELPRRQNESIARNLRRQVDRVVRRVKRKNDRPYPTAWLYQWRPEHGNHVNFGDELSLVIVELMLARRGATLIDEIPTAQRLYTVGSALHMAKDGSVIWGTGLHGASYVEHHVYKTLDIRAVRGPLTAKFLKARHLDVPDVYGDPGLLVPHLDQGRFSRTKKYGTCIVPHLNDMEFVEREGLADRIPGLRIVDPRRAWNTVVQDILEHEFVVSSSLHGVILAEAYGIPARYVRMTEKEDILKYHDYYLGTGRILQYARTVEEALEMGGAEPLVFDPGPLMAAFPYDLWGL